jgi:hypothetical protein
LVAQRICRYAKFIGRDNVIAGSNCGYRTFVGQVAFDPAIVWAKLAAMTEGARLASQQFWKKTSGRARKRKQPGTGVFGTRCSSQRDTNVSSRP